MNRDHLMPEDFQHDAYRAADEAAEQADRSNEILWDSQQAAKEAKAEPVVFATIGCPADLMDALTALEPYAMDLPREQMLQFQALKTQVMITRLLNGVR